MYLKGARSNSINYITLTFGKAWVLRYRALLSVRLNIFPKIWPLCVLLDLCLQNRNNNYYISQMEPSLSYTEVFSGKEIIFLISIWSQLAQKYLKCLGQEDLKGRESEREIKTVPDRCTLGCASLFSKPNHSVCVSNSWLSQLTKTWWETLASRTHQRSC